MFELNIRPSDEDELNFDESFLPFNRKKNK